MAILARDASIADLLRLHDRLHRYELVRGELRQLPLCDSEAARVTATLSASLGIHVWRAGLGVVYLPGTCFALGPQTVRMPAVAFVSTGRLAEVAADDFFARAAPDLAVEVVASRATALELDEQVGDWLSAGTCLVLVIDLEARSVQLHRPAQDSLVITPPQWLDASDVITGWTLPVSHLFST